MPELAGNPLLERVIAIFDKNKDDEIEFKEFISALSTFSEKGNKEGKLRCESPSLGSSSLLQSSRLSRPHDSSYTFSLSHPFLVAPPPHHTLPFP